MKTSRLPAAILERHEPSFPFRFAGMSGAHPEPSSARSLSKARNTPESSWCTDELHWKRIKTATSRPEKHLPVFHPGIRVACVTQLPCPLIHIKRSVNTHYRTLPWKAMFLSCAPKSIRYQEKIGKQTGISSSVSGREYFAIKRKTFMKKQILATVLTVTNVY